MKTKYKCDNRDPPIGNNRQLHKFSFFLKIKPIHSITNSKNYRDEKWYSQ